LLKCNFVYFTSFSEDDTAVIKSSVYFLEVTLKIFDSNDEEFINSIIQLVLFVLSKQLFSQDILNVVTSKLVSILEKFSQGIFNTKTLEVRKSLQTELQVHKLMQYV